MVKRAADSTATATPARKRARLVGPKTALPVADEAWRQKLMRTKDAVVLRAKTRQSYAKIKARTLAAAGTGSNDDAQGGAMHPDRQARLGDDDDGAHEDGPQTRPDGESSDKSRRRPQMTLPRAQRRPSRAKTDTLLKAQQEADQRRAEAARRAAERTARLAERTRIQKAMVRARRVDGGGGSGGSGGSGGRGGRGGRGGEIGPDRRKLGRESEVLLDRVRRMMKR